MVCILCVTTSEQTIQIFQDEGSALNIKEIIVKHFWLQPNVDDVNAKAICMSCWTALDSFHKFYLQVEAAHIKVRKTNTVVEDELKIENEPSQQISILDTPSFGDISPELFNADIKLEVQEYGEVKLLPDPIAADNEKTVESQKNLTPDRKHSTDSKKSVDNEAPPASSTRSLRSAGKSCAASDSTSDDEIDNTNCEPERSDVITAPGWQDHDSDVDDDDDDSDYQESTSKGKAKNQGAPSKTTQKRGRPKKSEVRNTPPRKKTRNSEEQSKKMCRIKEYDETIDKNIKLSCTVCLTVFANFSALKRHYRSAHNECGYVMCCGKKFRKRGILVDHIYTHQNPEYFKCEKCGRVLANRKGLDCHMLTHDTEKQRCYQCDQCTLSFYTRPLLTRHMQIHISERNVKCPECDKFFSTQDILRTHINNVHNAAYTRICDQCGKSFRRPDAFRRHQLEHDGITQPLVPCEKCGVKLTSKYGLKRHMESMHPETEITHVCNTCGKVAPSAAALQRHISYMHKMERKYKCPMCDKAFKKTGGLKPNKNDENGRFICGSCWSAVDSFHKFYQQVEEAHITLMKSTSTEDDDLKHDAGAEDADKFDPCADFLNADVKLEVKEDAEVCLPQFNPLPDLEDKIDVSHIDKSKRKSSSCSSESDDSESEIPLANLAKTRSKKRGKTKTAPSSNDEQESSAEWQDHRSDDDDDDEIEESDVEAKKRPVRTKTGKKRGRPCKNAGKLSIPKQTTEEQIKKRELSQEYDEIIYKNMKLTCNVCLVPLANFFALKKHYRSKHNERGYASCCGKKFLKRGILVDHIYTHLNPDHFKCDKCDKVLADRRCLEVHMNTHVAEKQRIYQCDQCSKSFFKKPLLTRHLHIHIPEEERKFPCEECNKFFPSNYTLRAHINNVHQNAYAKICDQCGKSIRGREAFQRHLLEHAGVAIPSVQCDKCGAKLKNKYGLKRHMNSMHAESNVPHVCNMCGKVAPNSAALQRHYSYVHKCERNHKCPMCDKAFKKAGGLKEHMTTHTGEVLYTCPHCPKTFNSNANMHSHRKKMHRKEWEENRRHPHMGSATNPE